MHKKKIRLRSDHELELQNKGLQELRKYLNEKKYYWFLSGGTLLGAVREGNFIRWDWDIEIALLNEEIFPIKEKIVEELVTLGFQKVKIDHTQKNLKIVVNKYNTDFELLCWYLNGDMRERKVFKRPARFFENRDEIQFLGASYPVPSPVEDFLEFVYGDWKTPKRTADKSEYFNDINRKNIGILDRVSKRFNNLLIKLKIKTES